MKLSKESPFKTLFVSVYDNKEQRYKKTRFLSVYEINTEYFHIYDQLVARFEEVQDKSLFNLSKPYGAKMIENPDYSVIEYFLNFLRNVACCESTELYEWFLKWVSAHLSIQIRKN